MTGSHSHHDHGHEHSRAPRRAVALAPGWSLLRMSGAQRFALSGGAIAALWAILALLLRWV